MCVLCVMCGRFLCLCVICVVCRVCGLFLFVCVWFFSLCILECVCACVIARVCDMCVEFCVVCVGGVCVCCMIWLVCVRMCLRMYCLCGWVFFFVYLCLCCLYVC